MGLPENKWRMRTLVNFCLVTLCCENLAVAGHLTCPIALFGNPAFVTNPEFEPGRPLQEVLAERHHIHLLLTQAQQDWIRNHPSKDTAEFSIPPELRAEVDSVISELEGLIRRYLSEYDASTLASVKTIIDELASMAQAARTYSYFKYLRFVIAASRAIQSLRLSTVQSREAALADAAHNLREDVYPNYGLGGQAEGSTLWKILAENDKDGTFPWPTTRKNNLITLLIDTAAQIPTIEINREERCPGCFAIHDAIHIYINRVNAAEAAWLRLLLQEIDSVKSIYIRRAILTQAYNMHEADRSSRMRTHGGVFFDGYYYGDVGSIKFDRKAFSSEEIYEEANFIALDWLEDFERRHPKPPP